MRTWVWIPRSHIKLDMAAHICNPSESMWYEKQRNKIPGHLQDSYSLVDSIKQNTSLKESRRWRPPILKVVYTHAMKPWEGYTSILYTHTGRNTHNFLPFLFIKLKEENTEWEKTIKEWPEEPCFQYKSCSVETSTETVLGWTAVLPLRNMALLFLSCPIENGWCGAKLNKIIRIPRLLLEAHQALKTLI